MRSPMSMLMLVPMFMLTPSLLWAQRSALPAPEAFDRELKKNRLGTWLVLEDDSAAWGATVRTALDEDALVMLNLPLRVVSGGKKPDVLSATLRDRFGWAKGAHWALVDAKGRIQVEGATQPTVASLAAAAEQAGVKSRTQELEAFLRQNPDHLEARLTLLAELMTVASRRTRRNLAATPEKPTGNPAGNSATNAATNPGAPTELPRKLSAELDEKIWSSAAQQLELIFQGHWQEMGVELGMRLRNGATEHSGIMVAILTRYKGDMEEAIRRRPHGIEAWMLWLQASQKCGGWPLMPLLQALQPLPGTAPGDWPPAMALNEFVKDAKARRDWTAIREVLEARWEDLRAGEFRWGGGESLWNRMLSPLLEALVSLGDVGGADQLLSEVMAMDSWSGLPGQARELAARLNRPDLAARWGALTPKGR